MRCSPRFLSLFSTLLLVALPGGIVHAQQGESPPSPATTTAAQPSAETLQKTTGEWIQTKRIISQEAAAWQTEKASLADLTEIRKKEIEQLDEFIKAAGARVDELAEQKAKRSEEQEKVRSWRADTESQMISLETHVKALLPLFPPPLKDKIGDALERINSPDSDRALQDRVRDLLIVLQAAREFDGVFTVDSDLREFNGERREVRVLYLGLSQAWYADDSGSVSGYGTPSAEGWTWTPDPSIASEVRKAIDIQTGEATAAFVNLPFHPASAASQK